MERSRKPRLLVAEDDAVIALDLESTLASLGCEVVGPVSSLRDALRLAQDATLDGAVLDVGLNGGAAYPVIDRLAERNVPVFLVTGYDDAVLADRVRSLPRLTKPFHGPQLAGLLAAALPAPDGPAPARSGRRLVSRQLPLERWRGRRAIDVGDGGLRRYAGETV